MGEMMKKKIIKRYMLLCIPFICGCLLYGIGSYGIVSSLLFFGGGYILIKNLFDYRMINKNINKCISTDLKKDNYNDDVDTFMLDKDKTYDDIKNLDNSIMNENICTNKDDKYRYKYRKSDNIQGLKNTRIHIKVRRRY